MKIGIFGLPNSGKSRFRRWLVKKLHELHVPAEHWDADRFKKARCPEDADMREPSDGQTDTIWIIEDVRGTVLHKPGLKKNEKEGSWKPIGYYDLIYYLRPSWQTYAAFWVSRALQWRKIGAGNWMRESGWEKLEDDEVIVRKVKYFLDGFDKWKRKDDIFISNLQIPVREIFPELNEKGEIEWVNFDKSDIAAFIHASHSPLG